MTNRDQEIRAIGSILGDMGERMSGVQTVISGLLNDEGQVSDSVFALQEVDRITQELSELGLYMERLSDGGHDVAGLRAKIPLVSLQQKLTNGPQVLPESSLDADEIWL